MLEIDAEQVGFMRGIVAPGMSEGRTEFMEAVRERRATEARLFAAFDVAHERMRVELESKGLSGDETGDQDVI